MAVTHLPLRRSIPLGVAAYVGGYLLAVGTAMGRVDAVLAVTIAGEDPRTYSAAHVAAQPLGELLGSTPSPWVVGAWLFYDAQFVPTSVPEPGPTGAGGLTNRHLIPAVDGGLFALYPVPPLLLVAAGYLVVHTGRTRGARGDLYGGASVALAYLPLLVVGAFVFTAPAGRFVASPDGLQTIWVGLVYPAVLGAIGGKLAGRRAEEPDTGSTGNERESRW